MELGQRSQALDSEPNSHPGKSSHPQDLYLLNAANHHVTTTRKHAQPHVDSSISTAMIGPVFSLVLPVPRDEKL